MKAIFYAVAILVTGGAAFYAYSHSEKFKALEADRILTIDTNTQVSSDADVAENKIKGLRATLATDKERRDLLTQSVSSLKSAGAGLSSDIERLEAQVKFQKEEFSKLQGTVDEVVTILAAAGGDVNLDNLAEKMEEVNQDKTTKEKALEELETVVGGAEKSLATNRAELDRLGKKMMERGTRITRNSMRSVITAVNQDWGFVMIGAGSNSGFTPQTSLIVERDGRRIGRVRPSSIEPTQTIAEIDFDSLSSGVRLQPGDTVILANPTSN